MYVEREREIYKELMMNNLFQAAAQYLYNTVTNTSMVISNIIGPVEQMALANHPVTGLYYMLVGTPEV